uniref:Uncharacterized protein n=1 Tax=Catharus ustulatus TaxID=91951 RepID=A0A8C3V5R6_CATUS
MAVGHWGCEVGVALELLATVVAGGLLRGHPRTCSQCHFINGTDHGRFMERNISNREQFLHLGSHVGLYWNSDPQWMEYRQAALDRHCQHNSELSRPFLVERRDEFNVYPVSDFLSPRLGHLPCSVMDFYSAKIQLRWFQGQQELSGHVVDIDVVANGNWTYQLLVQLQIAPLRWVTYLCQVEHVSQEHPLRQLWEMPPDTAHSKTLTGIGDFMLGLVFLALGLGFYVHKKVRGGVSLSREDYVLSALTYIVLDISGEKVSVSLSKRLKTQS